MDLIVAVYDDWGIGKDGTQPIALSTDRKFFRETTRGAMVIVGRRTIDDFPGKKPLPGRVNVALTRGNSDLPGFTVCHSPEEAAELAKGAKVGELWLTHYSPSLTRPEEYMDAVREIFPCAKAGKDGMSVELVFPEN